jgi:hypothetical protein
VRILSFLLFSAWLCLSPARAQFERIPLEPIRLPPNDLVLPGHGILTPEEAFERQLSSLEPLDLSRLDPRPSEIWAPAPTQRYNPQDDQLAPTINDRLLYKGGLTSQSGTYRFSAEAPDLVDQGPYIVVMAKELHTLLLRRNLLRALGYKIPPIKYLSRIEIEFADLADKQRFLEREVPRGTLGAPSRWVRRGLEGDDLTITLQNVALTRPSESDHYNVAFGVPPQSLTSRTLRSLIIPYALLDIGESINKVPWTVGRVENNQIVLPHFTLAQMNATYDDALWSARRLLSLSRSDLENIVLNAHFPAEVATLVTEKIVARRNSLRELFGLTNDFSQFAFDPKISHGKDLKDGVLEREEWPGYGARFAHGPPDSPFKDYGWFLFAEGQSMLIDQLVDRVNRHLSMFDINDARMDYARNEFFRGLNHFVETGEFLEQSVGTWFSPIVDGQLILSRDIVVGNYLGTDHMVQMADTFGYSIRLGGHLGIEGLPNGITGSASATLSYLRTYTHLRPVRTLKESVKEPYQNMIVPFVQRTLRKRSGDIASFLSQSEGRDEEEQKELEELFALFNEKLKVGQSLIITDRITPSVMATGRVSLMETRVSMALEGSGLMVNRLHLYRKDAKTLQVYRDNGKSLTIAFTIALEHWIPVLRVQARRTDGKYDVRMHTINLDLDQRTNPQLAQQMHALSTVLKRNNPELIDEAAPPHEVTNSFREVSYRYALFHWRSRHLRQNDNLSIRTPMGAENHFLRRQHSYQSGLNYRAFAVDITNYLLGRYLDGMRISNDVWRNPGQTTFGMSQSVVTRYEARMDGDVKSQRFLNLSNRKEGWKISERRLKQEFVEINRRYGTILFPEEKAYEATALKLFNLHVDINIYEDGVRRLEMLSNEELRVLAGVYRRRYGNTHACRSPRGPHNNDLRRGGSTLLRDEIRCGNFGPLYNRNDSCKRDQRRGNPSDVAHCLSELGRKLEEHLDFSDFANLIGRTNLYVHGQLSGFREKSEILIEPIQSNTIGEIQSRFWNGPVEAVRSMLGMQAGEFNGTWMREQL